MSNATPAADRGTAAGAAGPAAPAGAAGPAATTGATATTAIAGPTFAEAGASAAADKRAAATKGAEAGSGASATSRYQEPGVGTKVFNRIVTTLTRLGVSVWGSRELQVRGRRSGEWRTVPVNLLTFEGERYLVAPRGRTQWVRNLRVSGEGRLRVGRRIEEFRAVELSDDEKPELLRAYLKRWKFEVGVFFDGVDANSPEAELRRIAPGYPVFRVG